MAILFSKGSKRFDINRNGQELRSEAIVESLCSLPWK